MATVNGLQNVTSSKNTGLGAAFFNPVTIKGAILCPKGTKITATQAAGSTLLTTLIGMVQNDSKIARIYPLKNFLEFKDNSEKAVEQSYGYGGKAVVRDGAYTWQFMFIKGGLTLQSALRAFNGANWDFFFVDAKNQLIGTKIVESDGTVSIQAIPSIQFYAEPWGANDGKKNADFNLDFSFDPIYVNDNIAYISDAAFDILATLNGLVDMNLNVSSTATAGKFNIVIKDNTGINLYGQLSTVLANIAQWTAINTQTAGVITITTVTADPTLDGGNGGFAMQMSAADPDYPTVGGDKVTINTVGPTALKTAGLPGFESAGAVSIVHD